jgi:segregation and condensation protein B
MSLRAKLEAVIYAAEEPVTLAQLASLFADEALAYKAEQEAARAEAAAEAAAEATSDTKSLAEFAEEGLENIGIEDYPSASDSSQPVLAEDSLAEGALVGHAVPEPAPSKVDLRETIEEGLENIGIEDYPVATDSDSAAAAPSQDSVPEGAVPEGAVRLDPEAEARRLARQRDREVKAILRQLLDEITAAYASDNRGIEIREIAGGYRMATKPECHDAVRLFIKSLKPALKLSLPALETLAVIAYKQPVTAPEVNEIRGVDSSGVFGSLLSRKLITTAGRKQVIGRPILYKTTKEFLLRFGLKDVAELPSMEEFEKIAAIELSESDAEDAANEAVGGPAEPGMLEFDESASEYEDEGALTETATVPLSNFENAALDETPSQPHTETFAEREAPEREAPGREAPQEIETPPHD